MLKRVGATAVVATAFAVIVAATLGGTASAKVAKGSLCAKAGIGFAGPLSGGAAFLGDDQSNWVKLTLALEGDGALDPQKSATVARQMVSHKNILGMIGFAGSNATLGGGPPLDQAHMPYVSGSATLDTLATGAKGQKKLTYFYRVVPQNAQQARTGVPYIIKALKLKKGDKVMVVDDGEAYGIGLSDDAQAAFKNHGLQVKRQSVKETDANPGGSAGFAADIQPVALQAASGGYKLVYAPSQDATDSQTFTEDLKTDGYHGGFMATDGSVSPTQFKFPGAYLSFFGPSITNITKSFRTAYIKAYGSKSASDPFGAPSFVATQMLAVAISKECAKVHGKLPANIKSARTAVAKQLKTVKASTTILGYSMAFNNKADAYHGPDAGVTVFHIQPNGSYKQVYPKK